MKSPSLRRPVAIALSLVLTAAQTLASVSAAEVVVNPPYIPGEGMLGSGLTDRDSNYRSLAQSFRAEDKRIRFGFRLAGVPVMDPDHQDPFAGLMLTYRLYEGQAPSRRLIATRHVAMPGNYTGLDWPFEEDVGFVEADFSQVQLKVGAQYTVEVSHDLDSLASIYAFTSSKNPYPHGAMFKPPAWEFNPASTYDAYFRMTPVATTPCARTRALQRWIARAPGISAKDRKVLNHKLHKTLLKPYLPAYQKVACAQLNSFVKYVDQHSHRFSDATAVYLFDQVELIKKGIPCG